MVVALVKLPVVIVVVQIVGIFKEPLPVIFPEDNSILQLVVVFLPVAPLVETLLTL